jgi:acetoin utilization protein AcuC
MMPENAVFVHHAGEIRYKFNESHPFNPKRLTLAIDLLRRMGALNDAQIAVPEPASDEQLLRIHRADYVRIVRALSVPEPAQADLDDAGQYGLDTEDTPCFPGMHDAAALIVGGSLLAAELVMSGKAGHAYHMAGGLHHALPGRGSGFCVYNDAAAAIAHIRKHWGARVMYIDTDVHHGDGVQWMFYADPDVMTYSIHETGKYLFPGTGFVHERGEGEGYGRSVNMPVEPYTEDASWLECFRDTVRRAAESFKPDVIVSQHGCDAHAYDPLSHIHCSMSIYAEMPAVIHELAHQYADGRWIAVGGGGYDIWRVVPRAWSLVWLEMTDHPAAAAAREGGDGGRLPEDWIRAWQAESPVTLPETWLDHAESWTPIPRRSAIAEANRRMKELAVQFL